MNKNDNWITGTIVGQEIETMEQGPREAVGSPSLELFETQMEKPLRNVL